MFCDFIILWIYFHFLFSVLGLHSQSEGSCFSSTVSISPLFFFFKQHFSVSLFLLFWACVGVSQSPSVFLNGFFIYTLYVPLCVHVYTHTWASNSLVYSLVYSITVQSLSHVWLFAAPWIAARQASLSITNSWSLHKLMPSNHLILCWPFSPYLQSFPASGSFPMSQFFTSGGQSIEVSASASVLPMNIQDWFHSGWTCWICYIWGEFFPACAQSRNYPSSIFMTMIYLSFLPLICLIHFFL